MKELCSYKMILEIYISVLSYKFKHRKFNLIWKKANKSVKIKYDYWEN